MMQNHNAEAQQRWGSTDAYKEYAEKTQSYGKDRWDELSAAMDRLFAAFAACMQSGALPEDDKAQNLAKQLQAHITAHFYTCTTPILAGLGQMYVADERFRANIDSYGDGTAAYAADAIRIHCQK